MAELLLLQAIVERGLLFSLVIMAMYISSRVITFDDLTIEGSFGIGGAVAATLLFTYHCNPFFVLICAAIAGGGAGFVTAVLHTRFGFNNLISGIIVSSALFSLNLKIAGANQTLANSVTIFVQAERFFGDLSKSILLLLVVGLLFYCIHLVLRTELGFLLYATGTNPQMLTNLGKSFRQYQTLALVIANAIVGLAGALFVQYVGYYSICNSVGNLIMTLAGLIISEVIHSGFGLQCIIGGIVYQLIIAITFECNIDQDLNKLITALLIILFMVFKQLWRKKHD